MASIYSLSVEVLVYLRSFLNFGDDVSLSSTCKLLREAPFGNLARDSVWKSHMVPYSKLSDCEYSVAFAFKELHKIDILGGLLMRDNGARETEEFVQLGVTYPVAHSPLPRATVWNDSLVILIHHTLLSNGKCFNDLKRRELPNHKIACFGTVSKPFIKKFLHILSHIDPDSEAIWYWAENDEMFWNFVAPVALMTNTSEDCISVKLKSKVRDEEKLSHLMDLCIEYDAFKHFQTFLEYHKLTLEQEIAIATRKFKGERCVVGYFRYLDGSDVDEEYLYQAEVKSNKNCKLCKRYRSGKD
jgi:hypothetical protein